MPNYRRAHAHGARYSFTVVTKNRRPMLAGSNIELLREIVARVRVALPFRIDGWVVLPNHMHAIWHLPEHDCNYSKRLGLIKAEFSKESRLSSCTGIRGDARVWQPRFWEHLIRDESDWRRQMDYLHFNPVKHGMVARVCDWPFSSFHRLVREGFYESDWGIVGNQPDSGFGE
ncbi:REP-associated tyrosine transposase [Pseudoxanthomonas sacheonensis]|uniref:REP-associated tyrosine transposase n=1 Tax=Pseudoxanthomonas sacheonensis TaxID=443615 RepID=UPI0013D2CC41|nr:transposase [Pseudoxanthomonas sacheonensis]KAF1711710.1 transposase [Pseudoxanthomonas sacheonensis]